MGHPDDDVCHAAVGRLVEELIEKSHHALCSFSSVALHSSKFSGQEMVKLLHTGGEKAKTFLYFPTRLDAGDTCSPPLRPT